jgi:hypothetical protein
MLVSLGPQLTPRMRSQCMHQTRWSLCAIVLLWRSQSCVTRGSLNDNCPGSGFTRPAARQLCCGKSLLPRFGTTTLIYSPEFTDYWPSSPVGSSSNNSAGNNFSSSEDGGLWPIEECLRRQPSGMVGGSTLARWSGEGPAQPAVDLRLNWRPRSHASSHAGSTCLI